MSGSLLIRIYTVVGMGVHFKCMMSCQVGTFTELFILNVKCGVTGVAWACYGGGGGECPTLYQQASDMDSHCLQGNLHCKCGNRKMPIIIIFLQVTPSSFVYYRP